MRRILRKVAAGEVSSLGDTSTLADPAVSKFSSFNKKINVNETS